MYICIKDRPWSWKEMGEALEELVRGEMRNDVDTEFLYEILKK